MQCNYRVGFFIVRPCGRSGVALCAKCQAPVCDAHRTLKSGTRSDYLCYTCLPPVNDSNDSDHSSSRSSSSNTSSSESYSGRGGTFGGAGASGSWSGTAPSNPAILGSVPSSTIPAGAAVGVAAASSAGPATSLEAAGFSQEDADLFNEVASFDEKNDSTSSFDS